MPETKRLPKRDEVALQDKWRIEDLYASDDDWEADFSKLERLASEFGRFAGTLAGSAQQLYTALREQDEISMLMERVYVYAGQKNHEDMGDSRYQQLVMRAQVLMSRVGEALSFMEPEILGISDEVMERYLAGYEPLNLYRRYLQEKRRMREHILSKEMESVLAKAANMGNAPQNIFQVFNNADLDFGTVTDEDGKTVQLTHGRYIPFLESQNVRVRREAFEKVYAAYKQFKNTLAAAFDANVQQERFFAEMRNYGSSMEMELDGGNIPVSVYQRLIEAVHSHMDLMHRYVALRRRVLGVDELHMYDLHVPLVMQKDNRYSFEEAKQIVRRGLAPLGEDYLRLLDEGFGQGWIDVYENQGKRSGAYSWGAYGTHPYVLLNYNGSLNHVFTLAHEMGHAIHSHYSDQVQPYPYAGYRIFVAEVASTCNEALLIHDLLEHAADVQEKRYLINYFLDQFKSTLYRQTMFAEFEQKVHQMGQEGQSLTADVLCEIYLGLNRRYFGEEMVVDPEIAMEWARIPHFYTPFYVYQYATGFSAAIAISSRILNGEPGIVEKYKEFLSGGSSKDPIDLLKICGVDMTSPQPVEEALKVFERYLNEFSELV
ncbi:oligoendopeptidase F [Ruminococcus gauvreauii]|uniref:Oligopeptidase F n=1 Tax=Ruminococcus gauvreauii TaxID=438033 RepID=A0ABY5VEH9_9FIRM|nr:oligoendopeptidase F [Ruminococcus gauvreauii]UWP58920.1 oligoendopeptidase F [Ruminococcus gauvreauii]